MDVVVCDDEPQTQVQMKAFLARYGNEHHADIRTRFYESGEAFLSDYPEKMDILFLDIRMYKVSGLDIARHIRRFDDDLCIIFISNMVQYALEGYQVHAFNFLVKPFDYRRFEREMALACRKVDMQKHESISVKNDSGLFHIRLKELRYAETLDHKLLFHLPEKEVVCYISMNQLEKKLEGKNFFRCHQSFLINLACVEELQKDAVLMEGGAVIPVSRHRRKELVQAMTRYAGEIL